MLKQAVQYLTIEPDFAGQRIDNFLMTRLKNVPKTHIYRILRKGEVRVNKKRIQPSYRLQANDIVRIPPLVLEEKVPPAKPSRHLIEMLKERILYEDKQLLIINKPCGIPVHGGTGVSMGLVEALRTLYPQSPPLELAHRLDLDTSGCLILAKKRSALRELHELFRAGKVCKLYWAFTQGHWKAHECRVDVPLIKNHLSSGERIVKVHEEGKNSLTVFQPLKTYADAMLVEVRLYTGRTHQIRVHAQYSQHPIAGDEKYGDREFNKQARQLGLKRLFLHARSLEFMLSGMERPLKVLAPLDTDLESYLKTYLERLPPED